MGLDGSELTLGNLPHTPHTRTRRPTKSIDNLVNGRVSLPTELQY